MSLLSSARPDSSRTSNKELHVVACRAATSLGLTIASAVSASYPLCSSRERGLAVNSVLELNGVTEVVCAKLIVYLFGKKSCLIYNLQA